MRKTIYQRAGSVRDLPRGVWCVALGLLLFGAPVLAQPPDNSDSEQSVERKCTQSVHDFVACLNSDLNRHQLKGAVRVVNGCDGSDEAAAARDDLGLEWGKSRGSNEIVVDRFAWKKQGDLEEGSFELGLVDAFHHQLMETEKLSLRSVDGTWKIVTGEPDPLFPPTETANDAGVHVWRPIEPLFPRKMSVDDTNSYIWHLATEVAHPKEALRRFLLESSEIRIVNLNLGLLIYVTDSENKIDFDSTNVQDKLMPYVRDKATFLIPAAGSAIPTTFGFNDVLKGHDADALGDRSTVVTFYDGANSKLNFRYEGRALVACLDGSVKLVTEEQSKKLRWTP